MQPQTAVAPAPAKVPGNGLAPTKNQPVLMPERMGLAEDKRHDWVVDLPAGVTLEQASDPSYWAHVAEQMDPMDHIELRAEDGSFVAYLIVQFCERNYALVVLDRMVKMQPDTDAPAGSIKHRIEWKGPMMKFCVIRNSDDKLLREGERTKQSAMLWLSEHERTVGK